MLDLITTVIIGVSFFVAGFVLYPVISEYFSAPIEDDLKGEDYGC
tara:strand:+ start:567 stop:701 length:135 start_codon:yes stop_codon:yes gene_type:complete